MLYISNNSNFFLMKLAQHPPITFQKKVNLLEMVPEKLILMFDHTEKVKCVIRLLSSCNQSFN